jgi:E3 ubiquitin-protein ligase BRE1
MKYYSRESERCQSRIAELERQKSRCEAGLAAMETCWQQVKIFCSVCFQPPTDSFAKLIDVIGSLVQPEQLPSVQLDTRRKFPTRLPSFASAHLFTEIFDLSRHIPDDSEDMSHLTEAFNSRLKATEKLVSAFISICGKGTAGFQQEDLLLKYHAAQSEVRPTSSTPVS